MGASTGSMGTIEHPSPTMLDPTKARTWGPVDCCARRGDLCGVVTTPRPDVEKREEPVSIPIAS
jgi:hypothetical protein